MPHFPTEQNNIFRVSAVISLLLYHKNKLYLDRILTGVEKLIVYDNVRRKTDLESGTAFTESFGGIAVA